MVVKNKGKYNIAKMLWKLVLLCFPGLVFSLSSCQHRPLLDPSNSHYVRVYIDEQIKNITTGIYDDDAKQSFARPEIVRVMLYDRSSGSLAAERFLRNIGSDDKGTYYDGYITCAGGQYEMIAYSYGNEATIVTQEQNLSTISAFTNKISINTTQYMPKSSDPAAPGVNTPDLLFVARESINISQKAFVDTLKSVEGEWRFEAKTIVDSYYVRIRLKGAQYATSVSALLSGLADGKKLWEGNRKGGPVSILFDMNMTEIVGDEAFIYATFNTFGQYSKEEDLRAKNEEEFISGDGQTLIFSIRNIAGGYMAAKIDITEEFDKPLAKEKRWLLLDKLITIEDPEPPTEGGGFSPGVENWSDVISDIII